LKKIYLITHLYNIDDKIRTCKLETFLKDKFDVEIYMPYRDSKEEDIDESNWKKTIFQEDIKAINKADIVIGYVDGLEFDEGIGFEIGYALSLGKNVIILNSDFIKYSVNNKISRKIDPIIDYLNIKYLHIKHDINYDRFCDDLEKKYCELLNLIDLNNIQKRDLLLSKNKSVKYDYFIEIGNSKFVYNSLINLNISKRLITLDPKDDLDRLLKSKKVFIYSNGIQMHFGSAIIAGICFALKIPYFVIDDRLIYAKGKEIMKTNLMIDISCNGYIDIMEFLNERR